MESWSANTQLLIHTESGLQRLTSDPMQISRALSLYSWYFVLQIPASSGALILICLHLMTLLYSVCKPLSRAAIQKVNQAENICWQGSPHLFIFSCGAGILYCLLANPYKEELYTFCNFVILLWQERYSIRAESRNKPCKHH